MLAAPAGQSSDSGTAIVGPFQVDSGQIDVIKVTELAPQIQIKVDNNRPPEQAGTHVPCSLFEVAFRYGEQRS